LTETLARQGIHLITPLRKNRKPVPRAEFEKAILRRRAVIETVFDALKNLCQVEHTRHRSVANFLVNLMAGIMAYCLCHPLLNQSQSVASDMRAYPELRLKLSKVERKWKKIFQA
jgi:hypothetical protein